MQLNEVDLKPSIVQMAGQFFAEKGIENTKMLDLANALKISKKTIYKHFESKDELVLIVYSYRLIELNRLADGIVTSTDTVPKKLVQIIEVIFRYLDIVTPKAVEDLKKSYPELRPRIEDYMSNAVYVRFRKLLEAGIVAGDLKDSIIVDSAVLLYGQALKSFIHMRNHVDLPENFGFKEPISVLCHSLNSIFRGVLNSKAEQEFDRYLNESPKLHFLLKEKAASIK